MDNFSNQMPEQQPPAPQTSPVYPDPTVRQGFDQPSQQYVQPTYVYAQPAQRKGLSTGLIIGIAVIIALCIIIVSSMATCSSMVNGVVSSVGVDTQSDAGSHDSTPKVAVISLNGTIQYDGSECSPDGLRTLLKQAEGRDDIKAIVLRVNSGGGVATAGEEMSHYVKDFSKPVVVSAAATDASAAYEISSQADYIYTAKTTAIGSIGVLFQVTDLSGLYEKLGIKMENITSADSKDASSGTRPLTDSEREWYQKMVDQINDAFIDTVAEGRDMKADEVRKLANGLTYTGSDAVENGLADEVGYLSDAIRKASELAGFDESLKAMRFELSSGNRIDLLMDLLGESNNKDDAALKALEDRFDIN